MEPTCIDRSWSFRSLRVAVPWWAWRLVICLLSCSKVSRFVNFILKLHSVTKSYSVIEPLLLITICYVSYLIAELLDLSAILSIIFCAFVMMRQCAQRITSESHIVIKNGLKMLSQVAELIIFIFLGFLVVELLIFRSFLKLANQTQRNMHWRVCSWLFRSLEYWVIFHNTVFDYCSGIQKFNFHFI